MKKTKEQKRRTKNKNKLKRKANKKKLLNAAFFRAIDFLDVKKYFMSLPNEVRRTFLKESSWPSYKIIFHSGCRMKQYKLHSQLKESLLLTIDKTLEKVELEVQNRKIKFNDVPFLLTVYGLFNFSSKLEIKNDSHELKKIKSVSLKAIEKIRPLLQDARKSYLDEFVNCAMPIALMLFDYEGGHYPDFKIHKDSKNRAFPVICITPLILKKEKLTTKDGGDRFGFPCVNFETDGLKVNPVFFPSGTIENEDILHVYIQEHAISRLKERLDLPIGKKHLMEFLGRSLANPVVVGKDGGSFLIEYKLVGYKLGYLIVSNEGKYALVRSFKFITMTGTPEFKMITKKLRASKHDMTHLKLDQLDSMLSSDLFEDQFIKDVLVDCDLGHLNELAELMKSQSDSDFDFDFSEPLKIADDVKKLLKLDDYQNPKSTIT